MHELMKSISVAGGKPSKQLSVPKVVPILAAATQTLLTAGS